MRQCAIQPIRARIAEYYAENLLTRLDPDSIFRDLIIGDCFC